jgi:hypothetical protein
MPKKGTNGERPGRAATSRERGPCQKRNAEEADWAPGPMSLPLSVRRRRSLGLPAPPSYVSQRSSA